MKVRPRRWLAGFVCLVMIVTLTACGGQAPRDPDRIAKICDKHQHKIDKINRLIDRHGEEILERIKQRAPQKIVFLIEECLGRGDGGQPDVPEVQPTQVNQTTPTSTFESTQFLYTGENPVQTGVDTQTIEFRRAAVVRGKVINQSGEPVSGATVKILNRPEFGQTVSRADGRFDMVVNGGAQLTVSIAHSDFLPAQRPVQVPWREYTTLDDPVVLTELDTAVTTVDLTEQQTIQVHQASPETDVDGQRRGTMLFKPGTEAVIENSETGETQTVSSMDVRATEYTVGENGPDAMPAPLPPTSGYTYAAELSTSQTIGENTDGDSVFQSVKFSQPVPYYLENFLGVPVGVPVPVGVLDRSEGNWVPRRDGRVIKILSESNGLANVDVTGDGNPDTPGTLAPFGMDEAERQQLASLYDAGQELWRVPMSSFSPVDFNYPVGPPESARRPENPQCQQEGGDDQESPCEASGSTIDIHNQSLGERVDLVGVPYSLHYKSSRTDGYTAARTLDIPLTGSSIPSSVKRIRLEVTVAGKVDTQVFEPQPNLRAKFKWDGRDIYGREIQGRRIARIRIDYVYNQLYRAPATDKQREAIEQRGFAIVSDEPNRILFSPTEGPRAETTRSQTYTKPIGTFKRESFQMGGWGLNVHHTYDPAGQVLWRGSGERRSSEASHSNEIIKTIAGGGPHEIGTTDTATQVRLPTVGGFEVGSDGSLLIAHGGSDLSGDPIAETSHHQILRVTPDGGVEVVAGVGEKGASEDGTLAREANLHVPASIELDSQGQILFAEIFPDTTQLRRIDEAGKLQTVVGGGDSEPREGILAENAKLEGQISSFAVGPSENLYFALSSTGLFGSSDLFQVTGDGRLHRIRDFDGRITLDVDETGNVFVGGTSLTGSNLLKLTPGGRFRSLDGPNPSTDNTFDGFRLDDSAVEVSTLAAGRNAVPLYFHASDPINEINRVTPDRLIQSLTAEDVSAFIGLSLGANTAQPNETMNGMMTETSSHSSGGSSLAGEVVDGGPAKRSEFDSFFVGRHRLEVGPEGNLYVLDVFGTYFIRKITSAFPQLSFSDQVVPSQSGDRVFIFSASGRHLRTVDARTGTTLFSFEYNDQGLLTGVTDRDGQTTTIERDSSGQATAIVSPFGQTTQLTTNSNGFLTGVTNPAGEAHQMTYSDSGLLTAFTDPNGNQTTFQYSETGRLVREEDPVGGFQEFRRTFFDTGIQVVRETAMGRTNVFDVVDLPSGDKVRRNTGSNGLTAVNERNRDATFPSTRPDGTKITRQEGPDPRFGMQSPHTKKTVITTPSGREMTYSKTSSAIEGSNFGVTTSMDTVTINGRNILRRYDGSTRTVNLTSPEGRKVIRQFNEEGRLIRIQRGQLLPTTFSYNENGQMVEVTSGNRSRTRTYNSNGFLASVTDPLGRTTEFTYDASGRVTTQTLPDGRQIELQYDENGNLTTLTPPGRNAHVFRYTSRDETQEYEPPSLSSGATITTWTYNLDGQLAQIQRPDMTTVNFSYDAAGRLSTVDFPADQRNFQFDSSTGNLSGIQSSAGVDILFSYDGFVPTKIEWRGSEVNGSMTVDYDNNFHIKGQTIRTVEGSTSLSFSYDRDGLMTRAEDLSLTWNEQNAFLEKSSIGGLQSTWAHNGFGERNGRSTVYSGNEMYTSSINRDTAGFIKGLTEKVKVQPMQSRAYAYDEVGRLVSINRGNGETVAFEYDSNGNRVARTGSGLNQTDFNYDSQDRLLSYRKNGDTLVEFNYNANGELQSKTVGGQPSTTYDYDALGNLRSVILKGDTNIDYIIDSQNRRVGKKVDGQFVQGFLYQGQLNPVAELDKNGEIESIFVYGIKRNVPAYMIKNGTKYRIISNHLGSVRMVVNSSNGNIVQRMKYDAFGRVILDTNPGFQPFGFAGGLYERKTGLVHFGARDYDPSLGRWTSKDPISFNGGSSNLYVYASNNPVNLIDSSGKYPVTWENALAAFSKCFGDEMRNKVVDEAGKFGEVGPGLLNALKKKNAGQNPSELENLCDRLKGIREEVNNAMYEAASVCLYKIATKSTFNLGFTPNPWFSSNQGFLEFIKSNLFREGIDNPDGNGESIPGFNDLIDRELDRCLSLRRTYGFYCRAF